MLWWTEEAQGVEKLLHGFVMTPCGIFLPLMVQVPCLVAQASIYTRGTWSCVPLTFPGGLRPVVVAHGGCTTLPPWPMTTGLSVVAHDE
jgi:hypothetical protein